MHCDDCDCVWASQTAHSAAGRCGVGPAAVAGRGRAPVLGSELMPPPACQLGRVRVIFLPFAERATRHPHTALYAVVGGRH